MFLTLIWYAPKQNKLFESYIIQEENGNMVYIRCKSFKKGAVVYYIGLL